VMPLAHSVDQWRNAAVGTNGSKNVQLFKTSVSCLCLPMSSSVTIQNGYSLGHAYDVYMDNGQDVKIGDQLRWKGLVLVVKVVRPYVDVGIVSHVALQCEEVK
jgi:hypothetical protein